MNKSVNQWLREMFVTVPDVRSASTEPDASIIFKAHHADLVVSTWMGSRLYVYVLDAAPKVRDIKNLLKENTRNGIGTLFLVHARLLPAHDSVVKLLDWHEALMSLHDGFVYAFDQSDNRTWILKQVHFTPSNTRDLFRCWQLDHFTIENVTVRKREVQHLVRGEWQIGDIASPQYRRKMNYERVNQRFHYRTKYTQDIPGNAPRKRDDHLAKYYMLLGVDKDADEQEIKSAFRKQALQVHPDVSALPRMEADRRIKELNEAYEAIKDHHGWR